MSKFTVFLYESDIYARFGLKSMTEGLRTKDIPVTIADNATLPALIEEQMSPVRILCTDILFTAEGREWLKEIIELNKIGKNILLLCMCRKSLHAQVTQTALLTECKVQVVSVVSFSSAKRRMYECLKLGNVLFPNSKLTLNERRVIKCF